MAQTFYDVTGKKGFMAASKSELTHYCQMASRAGLDVILQEFIPGPATNIFSVAGYFDSSSRPLALFAYRRLDEWPPVIANSCLAESVPFSPYRKIVDPLLGYLTDLRYRGIMQATFKRSPRDGAYKLLEVNARSWTHNSFPTKCGLNIVYKAYLDSIGLDGSYTEDYAVGVKWINPLEEFAASCADREIMKRSWIKSLIGVKDYAFFNPDDPAPTLMSLPFNLGLIRSEEAILRPSNIRNTIRRLAAEPPSRFERTPEKQTEDSRTGNLAQTPTIAPAS
jgi:predicted ATP-grasp superfamily ATP-dependent carboligase